MKKTLCIILMMVLSVFFCSCKKKNTDIGKTYSAKNDATHQECIAENVYYKGNIFGGTAMALVGEELYCGTSEIFGISEVYISENNNDATLYEIKKEDSSVICCRPDIDGCYIVSINNMNKYELSFADYNGNIINSSECEYANDIQISKDNVFLISYDDDIIIYDYDKNLKYNKKLNFSEEFCRENEEILEVAVDSDNNFYMMTAYNFEVKKAETEDYDLKIMFVNLKTPEKVSEVVKLDTADYINLRVNENTIKVDYYTDTEFSTLCFNKADGKQTGETDLKICSDSFENEYIVNNCVYASDDKCVFKAKNGTIIVSVSDYMDKVAVICNTPQIRLQVDKTDVNGNLLENHEILLPFSALRISEVMDVHNNTAVLHAFDENDNMKDYLIIYDLSSEEITVRPIDYKIRDLVLADDNTVLFVADFENEKIKENLFTYNLLSGNIEEIDSKTDYISHSLCHGSNNDILVIGTYKEEYSIIKYNSNTVSEPEKINGLSGPDTENDICISTGNGSADYYIITNENVYKAVKNKLEVLVRMSVLNGICQAEKVYPLSDGTYCVLGMNYYNYNTGMYRIVQKENSNRKILKISADESIKPEILNIVSKFNKENQITVTFTKINELSKEYPDIYFYGPDSDIMKYKNNELLLDLSKIELFSNIEFIDFAEKADVSLPCYSLIPSYSLISEQPNTDNKPVSEEEMVNNVIINSIPEFTDMNNYRADFCKDEFYEKLSHIKNENGKNIFTTYSSVLELLSDIDNVSKYNNKLVPKYSLSVFKSSDVNVVSKFLSYFVKSFDSSSDENEIITHQMGGIPNSILYYDKLLENNTIDNKEYEKLINILKNTTIAVGISDDIRKIVYEETEKYLSDNADEYETAKKINNRLDLYFRERK